MTTITLNAHRTGTASRVIAACALEDLTFEGVDIPDGTACALLSPFGQTLAHAIITGRACRLNTATKEAYAYMLPCPAGGEREAFLAVGESENILALVPVDVMRNWLHAIAPPAETAPKYPTSEALDLILADIAADRAAAEKAANDATKIRSDVTDLAASADGHAREARNAASDAQFARTGASRSAIDASRSAQRSADARDEAVVSKDAAIAAASRASSADTRANTSASVAKGHADRADASRAEVEKMRTEIGQGVQHVRDGIAEYDAQATLALQDLAEAEQRHTQAIRQAATTATQSAVETIDREGDRVAGSIQEAAQSTHEDVAEMRTLTAEVLKAVDPVIQESEYTKAVANALRDAAGLERVDPIPVQPLQTLGEAAEGVKNTDFAMHSVAKAAQEAAAYGPESINEQIKEL